MNSAEKIAAEFQRSWKPDDKTIGSVRRFPDLQKWLAKPDKNVTRAELWEFMNRYEAGRQQLHEHRRKWNRWYRRLWRRLCAPVFTRGLDDQKIAEKIVEGAHERERENDPEDLRV